MRSSNTLSMLPTLTVHRSCFAVAERGCFRTRDLGFQMRTVKAMTRLPLVPACQNQKPVDLLYPLGHSDVNFLRLDMIGGPFPITHAARLNNYRRIAVGTC